MLTSEQKEQIKKQGMPLETVEEQIRNFKQGFPYLPVTAPATIGDGILQLNTEDREAYVKIYEENSPGKEVVKFVPASGAASRMFKSLFAFLESDGDLEDDEFTNTFIKHLRAFAFYDELDRTLSKQGSSIDQELKNTNYKKIVHALLDEDKMNYGNLPKGLLQFHRYDKESRTPVEEHFTEGAMYGVGKGKTVRLHFTVSPEHQVNFEKHVNDVRGRMEDMFGVKFDVSFSQQKKSTDTIAVNMDNTPFVEEDGSILFRPAGHGALLENLNDIDGDIIFIKNIDNVVPDRLKDSTITYKKVIGGVLLDVQEKIFGLLEALENNADEANVHLAEELLKHEIYASFPPEYDTYAQDEKVQYLKKRLHRPVRVCGMVENTGEPGGGPFWVKEEDGSSSLQIGETAQLNLDDGETKKIFEASTHFNPTDLVCGVKDYKGNKFNLLEFRDPKTGFITKKSKSGKELKAQELPGLWNGAMAEWTTIFVEVPLDTFNPVKTVNDLLRDAHQG